MSKQIEYSQTLGCQVMMPEQVDNLFFRCNIPTGRKKKKVFPLFKRFCKDCGELYRPSGKKQQYCEKCYTKRTTRPFPMQEKIKK